MKLFIPITTLFNSLIPIIFTSFTYINESLPIVTLFNMGYLLKSNSVMRASLHFQFPMTSSVMLDGTGSALQHSQYFVMYSLRAPISVCERRMEWLPPVIVTLSMDWNAFCNCTLTRLGISTLHYSTETNHSQERRNACDGRSTPRL